MAARSQREKDHMKNKNQVILAEMLKEETNKYCSDCGAKGPRWASWNLGVFLCIRCAGIHRNLGVHISKVKSVNLDSWTPEQMTNIQDWGNRRAGLYWECFLPKDFHRPQTNSAVETFIRNKYEHKKYVKKDGIPPKPASNAAPSSSDNKPEKVTKKKKDDQSHITIPKLQETAKKTTATSVAPRPKPQPSATPAAAPAPVKANPPSMDLLSLDSPAPVVSQPPPQPAQQSTSLADELIDFGAFQGGPQTLSPTTTSQPQQQQLASLSQNTAPINNEESLLKDDTATSKSTKDSIMALFGAGGASSSHQQQIYGVPGGMYISPQQQTTPHNMMNGPRMQTGLYHQQHHQQHHHQQHQHRQPLHQGPHHQGPHQPHRQPHHFMQQQHGLMHHAPPHQQHAQLSQIQNQMQNMKLHKTPQINQAQQPNQYNMYNTNQTMFNQQAMNSLMTNQHMMNYQQQQPKFVSTGPVNNAYPVGAMPSTGHTFNNQLWK